MRKILFPVLIVFALLLSACGTAKTATTAAAGLDAAKFATDWNDPAIAQKVSADQAASDKLGKELSQAYQTGFGTPTLIINGSPYMEQRSVELLSLVVNLIKNKNPAVQQCPATIIDTTKDYSATITTTKGDIVIDLLEKVAPVSVNSFVSLAQNGWFKDNAFFVVRDQFAMTGDKTNTGLGGPGYAFKDEIDPAYTFDKEGVVGMYNFGPGTNGSQFFILKAPLTALSGRYTIFGVVTQGMEVLKNLTLHETTQDLNSADKILTMTIVTATAPSTNSNTVPSGPTPTPATVPSNPTPTPAPYTDSQTPCKPFNILDEILPPSKVKIPDVTSADWVKGPADAPINFILYTDLQCPFCAEADPIINAVVKAFPNDVRLVFRHWPLASLHDKALQAARAAEAAGKQGKFFEMAEFLFTNQAEWSAKSAADFTTWLNGKIASGTIK